MAPLDSTDSDDTSRNLICSRFSGGKGPHYDIWEKNLLDAFEGKGDEDASWADTLLGTDPQAGLTPAQALQSATLHAAALCDLAAPVNVRGEE